MLTTKLVCVMWFLLCIISEIFSLEYLHFGGTEEESRQADCYLSADSGTKTGPKDELIRTQRSFWKLLQNGLFGKCGNCCNNCNYNVGNENLGPALSAPFQPLRPLPMWRPLQPLFGRFNYDNYGTSNYAGDNFNSCSNPTGYGANQYGNNGVNSPPNYDNNVPPASEPVYEMATELPPVEPDYQADNIPVKVDSDEPSTESETPYTNDETLKNPPHSNKKIPQIIYQPIIYLSPQYQGSKALNQDKQQEKKYFEESKEDEKPQLTSYEPKSDEEFNQPLYSSHFDKTNSHESPNSVHNLHEKQTLTIVTPCTEKVPYTEPPAYTLSYPPTNPSISTVSAVYNIITPSLVHSLTTSGNPYSASVIEPNVPCSNGDSPKYSLYPPNYIPLYHLLKAPAAISFLPSSSPVVAHRPASAPTMHAYAPIQLTPDDQPYRECPELFKEYHRKLSTFLPYIHGGSDHSSLVEPSFVHY